MRREVEEFFYGCGMTVLTGYGLTEASPLVTFPPPLDYQVGNVGKVMPVASCGWPMAVNSSTAAPM